jgi:hypothetical protein
MKNFATLLCMFIFVSACSPGNRTFSDAGKWIPADFNMNEGVLLVQIFPWKAKLTTDLDEFLQKKYPGKYVIVSQKEIEDKSGKYADLSKYRFAFQWTVGTRDHYNSNFTDYDVYGNFYDRSQSIKYPTTKKYNNYGQRAYIPFFNSIVKYPGKATVPAVTKNK